MNEGVITKPAPQPDPRIPPSVDERVLREQAELMMTMVRPAGIAAITVALVMWVTFYHLTHQAAVLIWACIIHPLQLSVPLDFRYIRTPVELRDPVRAVKRQCTELVFTGVAWGLAPWMLLPPDNLPLTAFMIVVLFGLCSAGTVSWAPYPRAIYSFSIPALLGLASALAWHGGSLYLLLALATLLYLYATIHFGLRQNRLLTSALYARFEKEDIAQRLAEQIQIAERANLEKTRFLASASHDLRQPLHSVALFGATLLARLKSTPDEPIAHSLMTCVEALETSFTAMLDVSRLDAGVIRPNPQPVALADLCRQLDTTFGRLAEAQGLALRFRPGDNWVYGDPVLLERLLGNLVHNALKYTQHGGVVLVARKRKLSLSVEVWDTGVGIEATELPHIFDEFYQVGNAERDRSKGLGMGLAIAKRLAKLMSIPITVHSRVGQGTVFKLLIPLAEVQQTTLAPVPHSNINPDLSTLIGKHVLIIDDEKSVRDSTAEVLRQYGMKVETADGKARALKLAHDMDQKLDLVITDLRLRGNDNGIDLVNELNESFGRQLPTLLITGDIAPDRVHLVQQSGLRVLYKPIIIDELLKAIHGQLVANSNNEG